MWKPVMGIVVLAAMSTTAFAQSQVSQSVSTRYGALSVGKDRALLFRGRPLRPAVMGNNSLDLGTPYRIGSSDVVLVTDNGGTGCPFLYYFVTVTQSGAKATPAFGTCAEVANIARAGNILTVHMPGFRGPFEPEKDRLRAAAQRHVFTYRSGVVTENGRPVR